MVTIEGTQAKVAMAFSAVMLGVLALAPAALGKGWPDMVPDVPGVGDPRGIVGGPPEVRVSGGRESVDPAGVAWIEVACRTSTRAGCSGVLQILDDAGRTVASASRELPEARQSNHWAYASFRVDLPPDFASRLRRSAGITVAAVAEVRDSLNRRSTGSADVTLVAPPPERSRARRRARH